MNGFPRSEAEKVLRAALSEDVGAGDVTTLAVVPLGAKAKAELLAKEDLVLAGLEAFMLAFELLNPVAALSWEANFKDGDHVPKGAVVLSVSGDAATLLTGERAALNLLQRLCGIATLTASWSKELAGTGARLVDTRKTTPGLRALEKYAVRAGGGANHRFGLFDGVLIKENHIRVAGTIARAVAAARAGSHHLLKIEVEATTAEEALQAVDAGADAVLLDNMATPEMARAVSMISKRVVVEASGNMSVERLAEVARTGVDLISAGALTHSARAADLSLLFTKL